MTNDSGIRVDLNSNDSNEVQPVSNEAPGLENRYMPVVALEYTAAMLAVLVGVLEMLG